MKKIQVNLPHNKIVSFDLEKYLDIDPSNLLSEILEQPSKHAWWLTLLRLMSVKKRNCCKLSQEYDKVCKQYEILKNVCNLLGYRKDTILSALDQKSNRDSIIFNYTAYIRENLAKAE